jgi:hypothetical protein
MALPAGLDGCGKNSRQGDYQNSEVPENFGVLMTRKRSRTPAPVRVLYSLSPTALASGFDSAATTRDRATTRTPRFRKTSAFSCPGRPLEPQHPSGCFALLARRPWPRVLTARQQQPTERLPELRSFENFGVPMARPRSRTPAPVRVLCSLSPAALASSLDGRSALEFLQIGVIPAISEWLGR